MKIVAILSLVLLVSIKSYTQKEIKSFTLDEVIELAKSQSYEALLAKHRFRGSYWEYRTYVAGFRPSLNLRGDVIDYNDGIQRRQLDDGTYQNNLENDYSSNLNLAIDQSLWFTGGNVSLYGSLRRDFNFLDNSISYTSYPILVRYNQPLNGYNSFKWDKKIEPIKYAKAKKDCLLAMERVASRASSLFFSLALAQVNVKISEVNYYNADTLFKIAQGRYQIGKISENELLNMELSYLNADLSRTNAQFDLEDTRARLRSFLGFNNSIEFNLIIPTSVPSIEVDYNIALEKALENNPDILNYEMQLLQARRNLARARSEKGFNADLNTSFGLNQTSEELAQSFSNPSEKLNFSVGVSIPIIDWGLGKGKYKMAQSELEVAKTSVKQERIDFEHNVFLKVMQFNLQDNQVRISAKADTIADMRYIVTKERFLIGKIDVLDLKDAIQGKDEAKRSYISSLNSFWQNYYEIKQMTLYDFINNSEIEIVDEIIE